MLPNTSNIKPTDMKKTALTFLIVCCTLALAAQEAIQVNFNGAKPTISDFAWAFLSQDNDDDEEEGYADESFNSIKQAWIRHREGLPQDKNVTLNIDDKNGFVLYESKIDENTLRVEMCFWNESDQKHKMFAYNVSCFTNGEYSAGQFDGLTFYRYDNATKKMEYCSDAGFDVEFFVDDAPVSYDLPRVGKDIIVNYWHKSGKRQKTLKWNGQGFNF